MLDRRYDIGGRRVDDEDPARRGGRDVHVIHADPRAADDRELRGRFEELPVDLRGAPHEERLGVFQLGQQLLPGSPGHVLDLVPRSA